MPLSGNSIFQIEQVHPDTSDYRARLIANGGSISDRHLTAIDVFVKEIYGLGLRSQILDCSPLAGNSLNSALVKLWRPSGVSGVLANTGFVEADYAIVPGLTGNGSSKYLNSGINPSSLNLGYSISVGTYIKTNKAENSCDIGATSDATYASASLCLFSRWSDLNTYFDCYGNMSGRITATGTTAGFLLGTRASQSSQALYFNGVLTGQNAASNMSVLPNGSLYYFAANSLGSPAVYSSRTLSFFVIGRGMSATQSQQLNRLVQRLMSGLGRA